MYHSEWSAVEIRRLEQQLRQARDSRAYRRTLAALEYARGRSVPAIAASLGVSRQSIYNWISKWLSAYRSGEKSARLTDAARSGRPRRWTAEHQVLLRHLVEVPPERFGYLAVSWTVALLREQIAKVTGNSVSDDTVRRALHQEQYVWKRPRYVLEPDPDGEKKTQDPPNRAWIAS